MAELLQTTLCYLEQDGCYLMLHRVKKKNDLNEHKWVGIGGHAEEGESPEDCLLREAKEETSLTLTSWRFRGLVTFVSDQWGTEYMCLYTADGFEGELSDCDEGCLEWVAKKDIPKLNLWKGDLIFFRLLQENVPFFSLKLRYEGDRLVGWQLNGKDMGTKASTKDSMEASVEYSVELPDEAKWGEILDSLREI